MSRLAPGRKTDMQRLLERRDQFPKHTERWNHYSRQIEDLINEGKDPVIHSLRQRLIGASRAQDQKEIRRIEIQLTNHVKKTDPWRFYRGWVKKG